jgi:hypothetical protein
MGMGGSLATEGGQGVIWVVHWLQKGVTGYMGFPLATEGVRGYMGGPLAKEGVRGYMGSSLATEGGQGLYGWLTKIHPFRCS